MRSPGKYSEGGSAPLPNLPPWIAPAKPALEGGPVRRPLGFEVSLSLYPVIVAPAKPTPEAVTQSDVLAIRSGARAVPSGTSSGSRVVGEAGAQREMDVS